MQTQQNQLNPFLTIWTNPKKTIRHIIETDPKLNVLPLAIASGIYQALNNAMDQTLGDMMSLVVILVFSISAGAISGIISLALGSVLFTWSGTLLGGHGDANHIRTALAWSSLPDTVLLLLITILIVVFGHELFSTSTPWMDSHVLLLLIIMIPIGVITVILNIWRVYILANCFGEVHGFSAWKGLATVVIGLLVVTIPILLFILLITFA